MATKSVTEPPVEQTEQSQVVTETTPNPSKVWVVRSVSPQISLLLAAFKTPEKMLETYPGLKLSESGNYCDCDPNGYGLECRELDLI